MRAERRGFGEAEERFDCSEMTACRSVKVVVLAGLDCCSQMSNCSVEEQAVGAAEA